MANIERFETTSGSVYEVDREASLIRRLSGTHEPTPSQGADGEWKEYRLLDEWTDGRLYIDWVDGGATITTPRTDR